MGAIYDLAGDAESRDIQRQAQLNQALQAFSGFIQKNREMKQNAPLIQAQTQNYLAETQAKQFENQRKQNALNAYLKQQQQASFPPGMMPGPTGWVANPNAGQMQSGQAIVKERENPLTGEKEITPEYQQYISNLNKERLAESLKQKKEVINYARNNPILTESTKKAIAAIDFMNPRVDAIRNNIDKAVKGGFINPNSWDRLVQDAAFDSNFAQYFAEDGTSTLSIKDGSVLKGSPVEDILNDINNIKMTGFNIAGTAYTATEKATIEQGFSPRGKSIERWKKDVGATRDYLLTIAEAGVLGTEKAREKLKKLKEQILSKDSATSNPIDALASKNGVKVEWE